jgi:pilus assembly protein CpaB
MNIPRPSGQSAGIGGGKNWLVLVLAIAIGAGGVFLVNSFIKNRVSDYEARIKGQYKTVSIVVPTANLPRGTVVSAQNMAVREIPSIYAHNDAVTPEKFSVAEGQRLSFPLEEGKSLLWAHLEGGLAPTFSSRLPNGKRAVTVPVDEINSISGMLQPKDKIDLILTLSRQQNKVTLPLLQDVLVLATGTKVTTDKDPQTGQQTTITYRTVTLEVTQDEAKRIVLAQDSGKLTALLRHPEDSKHLPNEKITVANLLGGGPIRAQGPGIEFIYGGKR